MMEHEPEWLIEIFQEYDDGFKVIKRGLDASPMVIKKFNIGSREVMAFSSFQRANKALTAFHFHPDFPDEDRRGYMFRHDEGHEIAVSTGSRAGAQRAQMRRVLEERISGWGRGLEERVSGWGRGLAVSLQTAALYLAADGPAPR